VLTVILADSICALHFAEYGTLPSSFHFIPGNMHCIITHWRIRISRKEYNKLNTSRGSFPSWLKSQYENTTQRTVSLGLILTCKSALHGEMQDKNYKHRQMFSPMSHQSGNGQS